MKKNNLSIAIVIVFAVVILPILFFDHNPPKEEINNLTDFTIPSVKLGGVTVKVELADTASKRTQGLSGMITLGEKEGLLFVFDYVGKHTFWMKDMLFAIDIIWIDESGKIIYIKKDARPESYPETFSPDQNAKYVLEVVSGFSDKHNLKIGDTVEISI